MSNKYLLAITCYNCAPQITRTLNRISPELLSKVDEVMVINNRSRDNLEHVVKKYIDDSQSEKIHLYRNEKNYSLGGSQKIAFLHGKEIKASHVIILHGDDQADSADILPMIEKIEQEGHSTVLGSRFNRDSILIGYDKKRIYGNQVLNKLYSALTHRHVEDLGAGLNIFALDDLDESRYLNFADKLTFNFEMLLDLIDRDIQFVYYPITWREEDQVSNARNFNVAGIAFENLIRWTFSRRRFYEAGNTISDYTTTEVYPCKLLY